MPFQFLAQNAVAASSVVSDALDVVLTDAVPAHQLALVRVATEALSTRNGASGAHTLGDTAGTRYRKLAEVTCTGDGIYPGVTLSLWAARPLVEVPTGTVLQLRCTKPSASLALAMSSYQIIAPCPPFPAALRLHTVVLTGIGTGQGAPDVPPMIQLAAPADRPLFWLGVGAMDGIAPDAVPLAPDWVEEQEPISTGASSVVGVTLFGQRRDQQVALQQWAPAIGSRHWALILVAMYAGIVAPPTAEPCSLVLTVYDDDGLTPLWEVGTDPNHANPYLVDPGNYQEQEIDVANGSATLGTVSVTVIDKAQIPGDQDSGWLTERLSTLGVPDFAGHRSRLVRFISEALGSQVVSDGPAGHASLHPSYAAYTTEIRDTRETERKVRVFDTVVLSLIPDEVPNGYGINLTPALSLIEPARPLRGRFNDSGFTGVGTISTELSLFPANGRRIYLSAPAYDAIARGLPLASTIAPGSEYVAPQEFPLGVRSQFLFRWRALDSEDLWKEIPGQVLRLGMLEATGGFQVPRPKTRPRNPKEVKPEDPRGAWGVGTVVVEDLRLVPSAPEYDSSGPALPANNEDIEFFLYGPVPPDERHPAIIETLPFAANTGVFNEANTPVLGRFILESTLSGWSSGRIDLEAIPGNAGELRQMAHTLFNRLGNLSTDDPNLFIPTGGLFRWRAAGSADAWTESTLPPGIVGILNQTPVGPLYRVWRNLVLSGPDAIVPAENQDIEFTLTADLPVDSTMTAGEFVGAVYDGLYSPRDPLTGAIVPSGVRYDRLALLQMTSPVRMRIREPIEDARDWLEKYIYAPTGWVPAIDEDGQVSPVSQIAPQDATGLSVLTNAIVEPSPRWDSGQRIINIVRFNYMRDYSFMPPDAPLAGGDDRQNDVGEAPIIVEFRDEVSIRRHGEQILELDGTAFRALGYATVSAEALAGSADIEKWIGGVVVPQDMLGGGQLLEVSYQLALLRRDHVHNRYSLGAPTMDVNVMRSAVPTLQVGDWVQLDLTWYPDYVIGRRGLVALGQVVALGDLDCAWRRLLIEQVVPLPESS